MTALSQDTFLCERSLWTERWGGSEHAELVRREWIVFQESGITREAFLRGSLEAFRSSRFYPTPQEIIDWGRAAMRSIIARRETQARLAPPDGPVGPDDETRAYIRAMMERWATEDAGPLAETVEKVVQEQLAEEDGGSG